MNEGVPYYLTTDRPFQSGWLDATYDKIHYVYSTPTNTYDHEWVAQHNFGLSREDAIKAGYIRFRLHTDQRYWNPRIMWRIRSTCEFNATDQRRLHEFIENLIKHGVIPEGMTLLIGDSMDNKAFEGTFAEWSATILPHLMLT